MGDDLVKQGIHILVLTIRVVCSPAILGGGEDSREVQLLVVGIQGREQLKHFVLNLVGAGVELVDFVDYDDGPESQTESLRRDELRLWHGAF